MKYLIFLLINISIVSKSDFVDFVTNKFWGRSSYLVALDIKCDSTQYKIVIPNSFLSYYFDYKYGFNNDQYMDTIKKILINNKVLNIDKSYFNDNLKHFHIVEKNDTIQNDFNKGLDFFLDKYFIISQYGACQKDAMSNNERYNIVYLLFKSNLPTFIDCETGNLIITDISKYKK